MHELTLAYEIVESATRIALENNAKSICSISLSIGELSGVVVDAMEFALPEAFRGKELFQDTNVLIETVPVVLICKDCAHRGKSELSFICCEKCYSQNVSVISGSEFLLKNIEIE